MKTLVGSCTLFLALLPALVFSQSSNILGFYEGRVSLDGPGTDTIAAFYRHRIDGYASSQSVRQGDSIQFSIATEDSLLEGASDTIRIYRYGASGWSLQGTLSPHTLHVEPFTYDTNGQPVDYKRGANWPVSVSLYVDPSWPSGFYSAQMSARAQDTLFHGAIPFVVTEDMPGSTSRILWVVPMNTYQAYNSWGGSSLYWQEGHPNAIYVTDTVSFQRPFGRSYSSGYDFCDSLGQFFQREFAWVQWMESAGFPVEYCADADLHSVIPGNLLTEYRMLIFPCHSEYWTQDMRDHVQKFIEPDVEDKLGGNVAFFAANTCYWFATYAGSSNDKMVVRKENQQDLWRLHNDEHEAKFISGEYRTGQNHQHPLQVVKPEHWIFKGTGIDTLGEEFGFAGELPFEPVASGESDDTLRGYSPVNTQVLARVNVHMKEDPKEPLYATSTYYLNHQSNGRIFNGGTLGWHTMLYGPDSLRGRVLVGNILNHFSGTTLADTIFQPVDLTGDHRVFADSWTVPGGMLTLAGPGTLSFESGVTLAIQDSFIVSSGTVTLSGRDSSEAHLLIRSGGRLLVRSGATLALDSSLSVSFESGAQLDLESGSTLLIKTSLTLASGLNLTVPLGATVRVEGEGAVYMSGQWIDVYGTFAAEGSAEHRVILDKAPGSTSWPGLYYNQGSSGSVAYAEVRHSSWGIYCDASNHTITNSLITGNTYGICFDGAGGVVSSTTVDSNSYRGIYLYSASPRLSATRITHNGLGLSCQMSSSPWLDHTVISENTSDGVSCDYYSSPHFSEEDGDYRRGYNRIADNGGYGLQANDHCYPSLGTSSSGGYNSIYRNDFAVGAFDSCQISAQQNFWGSDSTNPSAFETGSGSTIDHANWLSFDPTSGLLKMQAEPGVPRDAPVAMSVEGAWELYGRGKVDEALAVLTRLITDEQEPLPVRSSALGALFEIERLTQKEDFLQRLDSEELQSACRIHTELEICGQYLRTFWLQRQSKYQEALRVLRSLRAAYPLSVPIRRFTLLAECLTLAHDLGDLPGADSVLTLLTPHLERPHDESPERLRAMIILFADGYQKRLKVRESRLPKAPASELTVRSLPKETRLHAAYPNPFNPLTEIRFDLAEAGKVALRVYDILGREVATLSDGYHEQGSYRVKWDGHEKASGVYFIRLTVADPLGTIHQQKVGKLLLVK